jgi:hypothetical protein
VSDLILKSVDINNFRSIRGPVHAPLDAKVVLVHGENGAGKTSLLSAAELALTGKVQSLERADPDYEKQLLHRSATAGSALLKILAGTSEQSFKAELNATGAQSIAALDEQRATFFRERVFLPQSLLGQLLQIYQDARNDAASPLAQFVGALLGLDRLDALEAGLKPLADVRNVRKNVDGWLAAENEKSRLDRLLSDQRKTRDALQILASGHCPVCEMEDAGLTVGLGVDGSASNNASNLMQEVRGAFLLQRGRYGVTRVTPRDALRWATTGSAACLGRPELGTITSGAAADLVLFTLDELRFAGALDPLAALVLSGAHRADRVMVAGRWVVEEGTIPNLDLAALIRRQNAAAAILHR